MRIQEGKTYFTRCGLTVSITAKLDEPRDRYPMLGEFMNGANKGGSDFWMRDGVYIDNTEHKMDLVSEA